MLKLEKRLSVMAPGEPLTVLATDPVARIDIPLYCRQSGHACDLSQDGDALRFEIVKA